MAGDLQDVGSFTLLDVNVGLAAAVGLLNPLAAQLDAVIALGLGPLQAQLAAELQAVLGINASLALSFNPLASIQAALTALAALQAALQAALAIPNLEINASIAANLQVAAVLQAQLGLLNAIISASIAIKIPAIQALAQLNAALSAGPVTLLSFGVDSGSFTPLSLTTIGGQVQAAFSTGVAGPINPGDLVAGVILVTASPTAFAGIQAILKTEP